MNGIQAIGRMIGGGGRRADDSVGMTFDDWLGVLSLDNALFANASTLRAQVEDPDPSFIGLSTGIYGRSPVAFACLMARWKLFSQARFQFQQLFGGRTGTLFGTPDLSILEHPEPGETTVDLLIRAISDADLEGDWFGVRRNVGQAERIKRIRPDWTTVVLGSRNPDVDPRMIGLDPDTEVIGYGYVPGGLSSGNEVVAFGAEEVAHFHPNINPLSRYRGMPLLLSAVKDVLADQAATSHKLAFFRNAATPAVAISMPPGWDEKKSKSWIEQFEKKNTGAMRAYKSIYFNAGMKAEKIGTDFQQMTFKELQGTAETRFAAVIGIHPVVIGLSEGLQGSSLNAGNFASAARSSADVTLRWLWQNFCGSSEVIVEPPGGTRLWYDEASIPFLKADVKDSAEILNTQQMAITNLVKEGFEPDSAIDAIVSGDLTRLVHTGLPSVQLQAPGSQLPDSNPPADQQPAGAYRATRTFWPSHGRLAEVGRVEAGASFPAGHPLVRALPSLFAFEAPVNVTKREPALITAGPLPALLAASDQVRARRAELEAAGKDAGYESLAREFGVSRDTIRRRLGAR